ncbi:MAG: large-conductance mechanosensitive channel protein MscL [Trueperaceae bacterium]|nr:large-conductance mechanosensitive channel protein MscL [Trueperaceae bacterium]
MLKDFRDFINRGNVVDLAVAVIIGGAFGQVTAALVNQVVMPPLGLLIGGVDFSEIGFILRDAGSYDTISEAIAAGAPVIQLGAFLNTVINFVIIALVVFLVVRGYNRTIERFKREEVAVPASSAAVPADVALLTEIRDLLAAQRSPQPD